VGDRTLWLRYPAILPGYILSRTVLLWPIYPPFLRGVGHFPSHQAPFHDTKRSTVNVYKIDIIVDRLGSGARLSASFQIFALKAPGWNVLGGEGIVWGNMSGGGECTTLTVRPWLDT